MKTPIPKLLKSYNDILEYHNQSLRLVEWRKDWLKLSNGIELVGKYKNRCCKHIKTKNIRWVVVFDELYSDFGSEKSNILYEKLLHTAKSESAKYGQELNGCYLMKPGVHAGGWNKGLDMTDYTKVDGTKYTHWAAGKNKNNDERFAKMSDDRKGDGNPMFGKIHTDEYKENSSKHIKSLILSGEFTPNTNNRYTNFDTEFNGEKFRSSWEAVYHSLFLDDEYETLRIPYKFNGKDCIYIVDFVNHKTKVATEVKPEELFYKDDRTIEKWKALQLWGIDNGYKINKFTQDDLYLNFNKIDITTFDEKTQIKIKGIIKNYEADKKKRNRKTKHSI